MKHIRFIKEGESYNPKNAFIAHLPKSIKGKKELLDQINIHLRMPDYFGFNWDALLECLQDFHWIKEREIALIHYDLPLLDEANLKTYLTILFEATNSWKNGEGHQLEVVFPESVQSKIKDLIDSLGNGIN